MKWDRGALRASPAFITGFGSLNEMIEIVTLPLFPFPFDKGGGKIKRGVSPLLDSPYITGKFEEW